MIFSEQINKAVILAAQRHQGQYRKDKEQIPYVAHCYMVGLILSSAGFKEEVIIAGILHDLLEDTETTEGEIRSQFGEYVLELVKHVTNPKAVSFMEKRQYQVKMAQSATSEAKAIKAADLLHNNYSIIAAMERGEDIWASFTLTKEQRVKEDYKLLEALRNNWEHPLVDELEAYIQKLASMQV